MRVGVFIFVLRANYFSRLGGAQLFCSCLMVGQYHWPHKIQNASYFLLSGNKVVHKTTCAPYIAHAHAHALRIDGLQVGVAIDIIPLFGGQMHEFADA